MGKSRSSVSRLFFLPANDTDQSCFKISTHLSAAVTNGDKRFHTGRDKVGEIIVKKVEILTHKEQQQKVTEGVS